MELGEKLRQARLDAGLSQRQLCGDIITRNMLSQIENGSARPSMDTLRYLASRLGRSLSYFLEDTAVTSPNQAVMDSARKAFAAGSFSEALETLEGYRSPDDVFDQEYGLLRALCLMELARLAVTEDRLPYARELLERAAEAGAATAYFSPALERQRLLLLADAAADTAVIVQALPADDRELMLRARAALDSGDASRAGACLDAAENRESSHWHLLRGQADLAQKKYAGAASHFHRAEEAFPAQTARALEECYRELGDFKRAYEYACKQR